MKSIRVKTIFGNHQIYQEIINYPPEKVEYLGVSKSTSKGKYYESKKIKERIGKYLQKAGIPRMILVKPGNFDLIHSSRGIIPLTRKPWVMDIEHVHSFFGLNPKGIKNKFWKKFIERTLAKENCKAILCHCEATRKAFFQYLDCRKFKHKIKVLYPSSHLIPIKKKKRDKKIRILCLLSIFYNKGGPQVLKAFSRLEKKYKDIELWMRSNTPKEFMQKYHSKNIKYTSYFDNILPREKLLQQVYAPCDVFLYPSFCDSFGYSLIDAMIAKMPCVSTNLFAFPEMITHKKNGLIINIPHYRLEKEFKQEYDWKNITGKEEEKIINSIMKALEIFIKDKKRITKMGLQNYQLISTGKFSLKQRNKKLLKIYKNALN